MVMISSEPWYLSAHRITVLAKEGCHLCERAIYVLKELQNSSFEVEVIDITRNPELFQKYFLKIPVVRLDGKDIFEVEQIALPEDCRRKLAELIASLD
jgi:glutaredoxin